MRNIKKTIKVHDVEVTLYDRVAKEERKEVVKVTELDKLPKIPENCVIIEQHDIPGTEKEVIYSMSPETFVAHAKIVEE
jgi:phosphoglycerate dehydrogenase-like enzyme